MYTQYQSCGHNSRKECSNTMKYTLDQRLEIGREIYTKTISIFEASTKYNTNNYTARDYMRLYRDKHGLPPADKSVNKILEEKSHVSKKNTNRIVNYDELEAMSKEELIDEVIKARLMLNEQKKDI